MDGAEGSETVNAGTDIAREHADQQNQQPLEAREAKSAQRRVAHRRNKDTDELQAVKIRDKLGFMMKSVMQCQNNIGSKSSLQVTLLLT